MCQAHTPPGAALRTRRRSAGRRPGGSDETGGGGHGSAGIEPSPTGSRSRRGSRPRPRPAGSTRPRHRTRAPFQRAPARRTRRTRGTPATSGRRRSRSQPTHAASGAAERQGLGRASRRAGARRDAALLQRRVRREEPPSHRARARGRRTSRCRWPRAGGPPRRARGSRDRSGVPRRIPPVHEARRLLDRDRPPVSLLGGRQVATMPGRSRRGR